jgi:hypothetical protein
MRKLNSRHCHFIKKREKEKRLTQMYESEHIRKKRKQLGMEERRNEKHRQSSSTSRCSCFYSFQILFFLDVFDRIFFVLEFDQESFYQ